MERTNNFARRMNKPTLAGALCALVLSIATTSVHAALVLSIDTYTTDEISFSISGTFDEDTIGIFPGYLAVKNDWSNNYGVHTEWFSSFPTMTVNTILIGGVAPTLAQAQNSDIRAWNDNVFFRFADNMAPFTAGTAVSGSITLTGVGLFDPADMATLELVSGLNFTDPISSDDDWARLEARAVATVPVPAATWLFGSALLGLVATARRRAIPGSRAF